MYNVNQNFNALLLLKVRVEPHRNENGLEIDLQTEYCICSPFVVHIFPAKASISC